MVSEDDLLAHSFYKFISQLFLSTPRRNFIKQNQRKVLY